MKQLYISLLITVLSANIADAQLVEVVPNTSATTYSLLLDGNTMYMGQSGYIRSFNINDNPPNPQIYASGISLSISMVLDGTDMYVSHGGPTHRIIKLDTSTSPPTSSFVTENQPTPGVLKIVGNYLYYTNFVNNVNKIYRVDLTDPSYTVEIVYSGILNNRAMAFKGNYLYVAEWRNPGRLYKLDYTTPGAQAIELASGLDTPYAMEFKDDYLYLSLEGGNKIVRTDVTQSLPLTMEDVADIVEPRDIEFVGDDLYIIDGINHNHLSKFDTSTLGMPEAETTSIVLYPNPTNDMLHIKGLNANMSYELLDVTGRTLNRGIVFPNTPIELFNLMSGRYFLKLENGTVLSVIKK